MFNVKSLAPMRGIRLIYFKYCQDFGKDMPYNFFSPTERYKKLIENALSKLTKAFKRDDRIFALVLSGCWGRDMGEEGCELDLHVFVKEKFFEEFSNLKWTESFIARADFKVIETGRYSGDVSFGEVDAEIQFLHEKWFNPENPDFDLEVGNLFKYCKVLFTKGSEYETLANQFLPFYSEQIRQKRLKQAKHEIERLIQDVEDHGIIRGDLLCGFDELYKAVRWVIQFLFIKERVYPVDYHKWLEYQFKELLTKPEIYHKIQNIIVLKKLDKYSLVKQLQQLKSMYNYAKAPQGEHENNSTLRSKVFGR